MFKYTNICLIFGCLIGCSEATKSIDNVSESNVEVNETAPSYPPGFTLQASFGGDPTLPFCYVEASADAFVWASVKSYELVQTPYATRDHNGTLTQDQTERMDTMETSRCIGVDPALKLEVEVISSGSVYGINLDRQTITIYISGAMTTSMNPRPELVTYEEERSDGTIFHKIIPTFDWTFRRECDHCGPLNRGSVIGLFINHSEELNYWYLSQKIIWFPNQYSTDDSSDYFEVYKHVLSVKSPEQMIKQTENCSLQEDIKVLSENTKSSSNLWTLSNEALAQCWTNF